MTTSTGRTHRRRTAREPTCNNGCAPDISPRSTATRMFPTETDDAPFVTCRSRNSRVVRTHWEWSMRHDRVIRWSIFHSPRSSSLSGRVVRVVSTPRRHRRGPRRVRCQRLVRRSATPRGARDRSRWPGATSSCPGRAQSPAAIASSALSGLIGEELRGALRVVLPRRATTPTKASRSDGSLAKRRRTETKQCDAAPTSRDERQRSRLPGR